MTEEEQEQEEDENKRIRPRERACSQKTRNYAYLSNHTCDDNNDDTNVQTSQFVFHQFC